jgi:hypothetical protein
VGGSVNTGSSPYVEYHYDFSDNHSRLDYMKYPNGRQIDYSYLSGVDDDISRLSSLIEHSGGVHLEDLSYLGRVPILKPV